MRIVVPAVGNVSALADRLSAAYGTERISLSGDRPEIEVQVASESDGAVIGVLESVERWLDQTGLASAEMWLGEHLYRLARWSPEGPIGAHSRARLTAVAPALQENAATRIRQPRRAATRRAVRRRAWVSA